MTPKNAKCVIDDLLKTLTECEVSDWTEWSQCFGTCYFGQTVRNRDVTRPSLPDRPGSPTRRCPHLYETSFCAPDSCKQGSSEGDDRFRTPDRSILPPRIVLEKQIMHKGRMGSDAAEPLRPSNDAKAKGPLKDEERRLRLSEGMSQMRLLRPVDRLPELLQSQAKNRVRSFESEILKEGRVRSK
ncbi:unnamed protein product [Cylicostephanus goldi]|uniref:Spondin-like TSP1 domain-containing protein n=1 Tax=Cylicostephanus goldi TaxID=71465 RepID=A0A3P6Q008_CYLGO|nr:unnamed protein product [Cylicostephanus goldi]